MLFNPFLLRTCGSFPVIPRPRPWNLSSGFRTVVVKSPISGGRFASPLRSSADGRAFDGHCPSTCGWRQCGLRSFAIYYLWIILARHRSEAVPMQVCKNPLTCYAKCCCTADLRCRSREKCRPESFRRLTCGKLFFAMSFIVLSSTHPCPFERIALSFRAKPRNLSPSFHGLSVESVSRGGGNNLLLGND